MNQQNYRTNRTNSTNRNTKLLDPFADSIYRNREVSRVFLHQIQPPERLSYAPAAKNIFPLDLVNYPGHSEVQINSKVANV